MGVLEPNNHVLYRKMGPGRTQPCEKLLMRDDQEAWMRARGRSEDEIDACLEGPDFVHRPNCARCGGTNVVRPQVTTAYECWACGQIGQLDDFALTSCLGLGVGFIEEMLDQHQRWHTLDGASVLGCPSCATQRMADAYAARCEARRAEADQVLAGLAGYAALIGPRKASDA